MRLAMAFCAMLAGCSPTAPSANRSSDRATHAAAPSDQPVEQGRETPALEELFGQWQVRDLNGTRPGEIHVLIGRASVEAVSQCIPFGFLLPQHPPPKSTGPTTDLVCARMPTPHEQAFGRAAAAISHTELLPDGTLLLTGQGVRMLLDRPREPVLNPFQNTPGPGPSLMWGEWRVAAIDGKAPSTPMQIAFFRRRLELNSGCVWIGRRMEQEGTALRLSADLNVTTICERMTSAEEDAAKRILSGTVTIAQSTPRRRLLRGSGGTILIER